MVDFRHYLEGAAFLTLLFVLGIAALTPLGVTGWAIWNAVAVGSPLSWWLAGGSILFSVVFYGFLWMVLYG